MKQHLAIFQQPFLNLILEGKKTIESRFAKVKCAPHGVVNTGDLILMKESGGLVLGEFTVSKVESFDLRDVSINELKIHSDALGVGGDPAFWEARKDKVYATLIYVENVKQYEEPYPYPKKDRRGWVVISEDK